MLSQIRGGSSQDDPDGPGRPALLPDHLSQIFLGNREFNDGSPFSLRLRKP